MDNNVATVNRIYEAFGKGDVPTINQSKKIMVIGSGIYLQAY